MDAADLREPIREFVQRHVNAQFRDGDDVFGLGQVDSLFAIQLVLFLERTFGIKVENRDLDLRNFRSVDAMASFIGRKREAGH